MLCNNLGANPTFMTHKKVLNICIRLYESFTTFTTRSFTVRRFTATAYSLDVSPQGVSPQNASAQKLFERRHFGTDKIPSFTSLRDSAAAELFMLLAQSVGCDCETKLFSRLVVD